MPYHDWESESYDCYSSRDSSSLTPLSGVNRSWSNRSFKDIRKVPTTSLEQDNDLRNNSSSSTTSSTTSLSDVGNNRLIVHTKETMPYHDWESESYDCYSSRDSSSLTPLSGVNRSYSNRSFKVILPLSQSGHAKSRDLEGAKLQVLRGRKNYASGMPKSMKHSLRLEVISRGSRLMREIEFPTVIIQMKKKYLYNSMVYYVVLNSVAGRYSGDIAGLLYARPCSSEKVQRAELLPLHMVRSEKRGGKLKMAPMLLRKQYRCLFKQGSFFRVITMEFGRRSASKKRLWKNYNLKNLETHDLLRRLLHLDISLIPNHLLKQMTPLRLDKKHPDTRRRRRKSYVGLLWKETARIVPIQKDPYDNINCHHQRFNYAVSSNFSDRYITIPPQIHLTKDFLDDFLNKGKNNARNNTRQLTKSLRISNII